jgi:hypothetical protein
MAGVVTDINSPLETSCIAVATNITASCADHILVAICHGVGGALGISHRGNPNKNQT